MVQTDDKAKKECCNTNIAQHKCKRTPACNNKENKQDTTQCSNKTNAWYNKKVKEIRMSEHGTTR